jgi:RNA polymerase sigma factor (sigma-70 family)
MSNSEENHETILAGAAQFATTRWSVVLSARDDRASQAQASLATLCQTYWYPLYVYVRRQGHGAPDAQDLTQEFFARLLEQKSLEQVRREKGKFRSFLLASLKHFLANEWDRARALKRGGGQELISLDADSAETRYSLEPTHGETADKIFDRRWALTLLDATLNRLRQEFANEGKAKIFEALKFTLTAERGTTPYADLATTLGLSEGAVKVSVHRLRQRYREVLRAEIADTVGTAGEVEEELRHLFAALSG